MSRFISDKYREVQQTMLNRFNQLKANEEELNRIFIGITPSANREEKIADV